MSRIGDRVKEIKAYQEMDKEAEIKKTPVSLRVEDFTIFCIDKLIQEIGGSRAGICQELLGEALLEALEALDHTLDSLQAEYLETLKARVAAKGGK